MATVGKESGSETAEDDDTIMPVSDIGAKLALDRIMGNPQQEMLNGVPRPNTLNPQPTQLKFARTPPPAQPQPQGTLPVSRLPYRLPGQEQAEWEKPEGDTTITPGGQRLIQGAGRTLGIAAYPSQATGMGIQGGLEALKNKPSIGKTGKEPQPNAAANADPFQYMPGGAKFEEYQKLPIWQKFLYELPGIVAAGVGLSVLPSATETSGILGEAASGEGNKAILAQMGQSALSPAVAVEKISAKILNALLGKSVKWLQKTVSANPEKWTDTDYQSYLLEKAFADSDMYKALLQSGQGEKSSYMLEGKLREAFYKMATLDPDDITDASRILSDIYNSYPQLRPGTKALTIYEGLKFTPEEEAAMNELLKQQAAKVAARSMAGNRAVGEPSTSAYQPMSVANLESGQPPIIPPIETSTKYPEQKDLYHDAIIQLNQTAKEARTLRPQQTAERRAELARRAALSADILAEGKGEQAFKSAKMPLKGQLAGEQFSPLSETFTQEHIDALKDKIRTANLLPLTKLDTSDILDKLLYSGQVPTELEYKKLQAAFGTDLDVLINAKRSKGNIIWRNIIELLNLPRSFATSFDNSMPLRQLAIPVLGDAEKYAWPAIKDSFGGMASGQYATEAYQKITDMEMYPWMVEGDLVLTNPDSNARLAGQEDIFVSKFAKAIPIIGQGIKMSERGAITANNSVRANMFSNLAKAAQAQGNLNVDTAKQIAGTVHILTGRGGGKMLNKVAPLLNSVLFSVKYQASIVQTIPTLFDPNMPSSVRIRTIKQFSQWLLAAAAISGAVKLAAGDDSKIELDQRSTDFGKVRVGNIRVDMGKGFLQYIRFATQFITQMRKLETGEMQKVDRISLIESFARSKSAPGVSLLWDLAAGKMYGGEDVTVGKELYSRMLPMVYQDMYEAFKEDGLMGLALSAPGFMGVNVNTYASQEVEDWRAAVEQTMGKDFLTDKMGQFTTDYQEQLPSWGEYFSLTSTRERDAYLKQHPEVEASMYFWGHRTSITNPQAWAITQQMLEKYGLPETILPVRPVKNAISLEGKTDAEITGMVLDLAPKYLADYLQKNTINTDMETLYGRLQQRKSEDQDLLDKYNRDTLGMTTSQREQYRYRNPEIDAALNLWGQVGTFKSVGAREELKRIATEWGIPYTVFPAFSSSGGGKSGFTLPK